MHLKTLTKIQKILANNFRIHLAVLLPKAHTLCTHTPHASQSTQYIMSDNNSFWPIELTDAAEYTIILSGLYH